MTALEVLTEARALIARPDRWVQGGSAMNLRGAFCSALSPAAVCWSADGVVLRAAKGDIDDTYVARRCLKQAVDTDSLIDWNDAEGRTHAEVLAAFDAAIRLAKEASNG